MTDSFECLRSLVLAAHSNYFECVSRYSIGKDWKPTYLEVKGKWNTINQSYTAVINYPSNYAFSLLIALCISYGDKKKKLVEYLATCQLIMSDYVKSWSKKWKIINQESRSQKTKKKNMRWPVHHWEPGPKILCYYKPDSRILS